MPRRRAPTAYFQAKQGRRCRVWNFRPTERPEQAGAAHQGDDEKRDGMVGSSSRGAAVLYRPSSISRLAKVLGLKISELPAVVHASSSASLQPLATEGVGQSG